MEINAKIYSVTHGAVSGAASDVTDVDAYNAVMRESDPEHADVGSVPVEATVSLDHDVTLQAPEAARGPHWQPLHDAMVSSGVATACCIVPHTNPARATAGESLCAIMSLAEVARNIPE